jgi:hypothetical protein
MPDDDNRPEFLKQLDTFNTAEEFGMPGILKEQIEQKAADREPSREREAKPAAEREIDHEAYAPLNSSIQEMAHRFDNRFADMERMVDQKMQNLSPRREQETERVPSYLQGLDPDMPVSVAQMQAMYQEYRSNNDGLTRQSNEAQLRTEHMRAHLEYERFKSQNPDFAKMVTPQEIDQNFQRFIGNDVNRAKSINWTGNFATLYNEQAQPRYQSRIAELEKEVADLKKRPTNQERISPATSSTPAPTSRSSAIESVTNSDSFDVTHLPSFQKGKSFKSFANDLKRKYGITNSQR